MAVSKPFLVAKRVRVLADVCGDFPFQATTAKAGEYECTTNGYGAVSIEASNGKMLGIMPDEYDVLEWQENPYAR